MRSAERRWSYRHRGLLPPGSRADCSRGKGRGLAAARHGVSGRFPRLHVPDKPEAGWGRQRASPSLLVVARAARTLPAVVARAEAVIDFLALGADREFLR